MAYCMKPKHDTVFVIFNFNTDICILVVISNTTFIDHNRITRSKPGKVLLDFRRWLPIRGVQQEKRREEKRRNEKREKSW